MPVLEVEDLSVVYAGQRSGMEGGSAPFAVLRNINLTIEPGEVVAVVGESGSGKTTLGLAVLGLLPVESGPRIEGSIRLSGTEIVGAEPQVMQGLLRADLGAVFQDPMSSLDPTMRIGRQLAEANPGSVTSAEWLRRVGIQGADRVLRSFPHELSGGQRQRVMIALAMAKNPKLVVADEPTTALDVTVQAQILQLIRQLCREEGTAFIFITHDLAVASALADRIVVLYAGQIVERGPTQATVNSPAHPYTAALLSARFNLTAPRDRQLPTIANYPARAITGETACAFAPRCILSTDICAAAVPPHVPARGHDGTAACHHAEKVSADLWRSLSAEWPVSAAVDAEPLLRFTSVEKTFRGRGGRLGGLAKVQALRDVSFSIGRGEVVAIVGESGSGKSTLLKLATGALTPDSGQIDYRADDRPQIVFQAAAASLTPWLSIETQIDDRLRRFERSASERRRRIAEAFEFVGLPPALASAYPGQISGGQAQRVAIARAIVVPPKLLLCDEAVSAMDVSLAAATLNLLGSLRRQLGMSILFVTHDLAAARFIADRIIVLRNGEIIETGTSENLISTATHAYTRQLIADSPDQLGFRAAG